MHLTALLEALEELRGNFPPKGFGRLIDGRQPSQASLQALSRATVENHWNIVEVIRALRKLDDGWPESERKCKEMISIVIMFQTL